MKQWIVYQTTNLINKKIYVGVHKTIINKKDNYIGCGVYTNRPSSYNKLKTPFQKAVHKYGINNFERITLHTFNNEKEAYLKEAEIVNDFFIKNKNNYNLIIGGRRNTNHANTYVNIYMYDLHRNFIQKFNTVIEANLFINPHSNGGGHISRNIKKGYLTNGYIFSYIELDSFDHYKKKIKRTSEYCKQISIRKSKKVAMLNLDGIIVNTFNSLKECRTAGFTNAQAVIEKRRSHCKGYIFKYIN